MALSLREFARRLGTGHKGPLEELEIDSLATPAHASSRDISFCVGSQGADEVSTSVAAAIVANRADAHHLKIANALIVEEVLIAISRATAWLPVRRNALNYFRKTDCTVAPSAEISGNADLASSVRIGERTVVESGAVICGHVSIGAFCRIGSGAMIFGPAKIGNRVHIGAGTVIGESGFSLVQDGSRWLRVPSFGGVQIGDDVTILAQVVVHGGVFGDTFIANGCALDSQVLIGHDSRVGEHTAIAGQTAVAGAANIGRHCLIGGKVGIGEGIVVADRVTVTAVSMVTRSIEEDGSRHSSGWPAELSSRWWRRVANIRRASGRSSRSKSFEPLDS